MSNEIPQEALSLEYLARHSGLEPETHNKAMLVFLNYIRKKRKLAMSKKLWKKCQKCGCDKVEDTEKLCEQCKAKRRQFWSDVKKVGGVAAGALLVVIAGGKMRKK